MHNTSARIPREGDEEKERERQGEWEERDMKGTIIHRKLAPHIQYARIIITVMIII